MVQSGYDLEDPQEHARNVYAFALDLIGITGTPQVQEEELPAGAYEADSGMGGMEGLEGLGGLGGLGDMDFGGMGDSDNQEPEDLQDDLEGTEPIKTEDEL